MNLDIKFYKTWTVIKIHVKIFIWSITDLIFSLIEFSIELYYFLFFYFIIIAKISKLHIFYINYRKIFLNAFSFRVSIIIFTKLFSDIFPKLFNWKIIKSQSNLFEKILVSHSKTKIFDILTLFIKVGNFKFEVFEIIILLNILIIV